MVGACTIGALAGAGALLFLFGELESYFSKRWPMKVALTEAGGIRKGSLVTVNGVPVGAVAGVELWGDRENPVLVTLLIDEAVRIPEPSTVSVQASLLGSGARLELTAQLPLADPPKTYSTATLQPLRGKVQSLETRVAEQLDVRLRPIADAFSEVGTLARNLNDLVAPAKPGESPNPDSLRSSIRRLNDTLAKAESALASAQSWLDDEQLRTDVRDTMHGASEFMRDATTTVNRISTLADSLDADAKDLKANVLPVLSNAERALDELNRLFITARSGDGTVGKLMKDPALYDGLADASRRLDEALAKVNLLLDKIRAEGIGVELFAK